MPRDFLSALPAELLDSVGSTSTPRDLTSLLLTNKALNARLTPALYASVEIDHYDLAQKCIRTLSAEPSTLAFGRALAPLVRSFALRYSHYNVPAAQQAKLARRLVRAVGRMSGLQRFALDATNMGIPDVCAALARAAPPALRTLEFDAEAARWWPKGSDADTLRGVRPSFPELRNIVVDLADEEVWLDFFERVLTARAAHLRTLAITAYPPHTLTSVLRNTAAWACLEDLELRTAVTVLATLPSTPSVRRLTLRMSAEDDALEQLALPPDACPNLESLACPYQLLPLFLPEDAQKPRPIRTVRLDDASYDETGGSGDFSRASKHPAWNDVLEALECLPHSAGPVTDLSFYVDWFDSVEFGEDLAPYAGTLERLVVAVHQEPAREDYIETFGETLFAHTPRLHTFLLSDAPIKADGLQTSFATFRSKQLEWLEEWDEHTDELRKVAFTTEFLWTKTEDGWKAGPRLQAEESYEEDEEEDEEEEVAPESDGSVDLNQSES